MITRLRLELGENIECRRVSDQQVKLMVCPATRKHVTCASFPLCVQFAVFVDAELLAVKASLTAECCVRETEDDAIEGTLTTYTKKLQSSLHVLNSEG